MQTLPPAAAVTIPYERFPFQPSVGQVAFLLMYLWITGFYLYSLILRKRSAGLDDALIAHEQSDCSLDEQRAPRAAAAAAVVTAAVGGLDVGAVAGTKAERGRPTVTDGVGTKDRSHAPAGPVSFEGRTAKHQVERATGAGGNSPEGRPLLPVRTEGDGFPTPAGSPVTVSAAPTNAACGNKSLVGDLDDSCCPSSRLSGKDGGGGTIAFFRELFDTPLSRMVLRGDAHAVADAEPVLRACVELGALLLWLFLCDRTAVFPGAEKSYSRDVFLFIFGTLVAVAGTTSLSPSGRAPIFLNRPQTEEWKGWMQVLFLLYHYFEARELYNAIRILIAGYVWMTGFGNFSYYYKTGDFSVGRFAQMMWRLNFLVFFCCLVLNNSYMLYYICPMHTIFTVLVYGCLALAPALNKVDAVVWAKIALSAAFVFLFWDVKPVFYVVWRPFGSLVAYIDPRKPRDTQDPMHEWFFRSSLDRYVWIYGMICAFVHPTASRWLAKLDDPAKSLGRRWAERTVVVAGVMAVAVVYYKAVYVLPKLEYNQIHPYTSWIPLTIWIVLRNLTPGLRLRSLRLFGWLGTITLETYLCQFHVWLRSEVADGQPKLLLALVPGYPLVNFALTSSLYIIVSHRFFVLTNTLKDVAVPHDDNRKLLRNSVLLAGGFALALGLGWVARGLLFAAELF